MNEIESSDADHALAEWVAEVSDRIEAGEPIDIEAYEAEHPELAGRLGQLVPTIKKIARFRDSTGVLTESDEFTKVDPIASLGDFRTIRVLGRGGMGVVYEAVQVSLDRRVALKILPANLAGDPRRLKRFQIEAQAAACLNHPHIVPVHVVGCERGLYYYVMQIIEGRTLAEVIADDEPLSSRTIAEWGRQAAQGLHFAHEHGIVHRDVKPSNLLIDGSGHLWVADFGLARFSGESDLTATGDLLGTLRYLSPEQVLGARALIDHRVDVYALGVTLYELLTRQPAFPDVERLDLIRSVASEEPRAPRVFNPTIPRDLETIVLKAIAKSPADRYATADDLADDLSRFLDGQPIQARRPSVVDRVARWSRRHRTTVAMAGVFLLAGLLGLGATASLRFEMLSQHNRALKSALERADRHEQSMHQLWYDSQLRLAQQSLETGQAEFAQEMLERLRPELGERDRRGFEWHYLHRLCHRDVSGFEGDAFALALSPDGRSLALGEGSGLIRLWDLDEWRERGRSTAYSSLVDGLWFSHDGRTLVSRGNDPGKNGHVKFWDPVSLRERPNDGSDSSDMSIHGISADSQRLVRSGGVSKNQVEWCPLGSSPVVPPIPCDRTKLSDGGRWLLTADDPGAVTLRDSATGQTLKVLPGPYSGIQGMNVSPDGQTIALSVGDAITFWDTASSRRLGSVVTPSRSSIAFSPDGSRLIGYSSDQERGELVLINDVRTNPRAVALEGITGRNLHASFSPDGSTLAVGGIRLPATLWDASSGRKRVSYPFKTGHIRRLLFTPDGQSLIFACEDGRVRSWHVGERSQPHVSLAGHAAEVWSLAYTPDGSTLISAGDDHQIKLWNSLDGTLKTTLEGHTQLVASLAVSPDGSTLASASFDRTVRLWQLPEGRPLSVLHGHTDRVRTVVFSPDGRQIATAGSDGKIRLWDLATGTSLCVYEGHSDTVRALAFHPGGRLLVSSSDDRTIRGWDLDVGRELFSLPCPKHNSALAFSHDGLALASGDDWGNVTIWDVSTRSRRTSVKGSDAPVWGLSFSPDGRSLAAACGDASIRLWDPSTGQVCLILGGHAQRVNSVAFSPDGRTLASASHDGAIKLWPSVPR